MWPDTNWIVPEWPAPQRVRAVFTTRAGGVSQGPFAALNLGRNVGDSENCVLGNRAHLAQALPATPVYLKQVHGIGLVEFSRRESADAVADGSMTRASRVACTVLVADCLPIFLSDDSGTQVAALHAGWRGLVGQRGAGIVEVACRAMDSSQGATLAWLGPCIGPAAFEVGDDVRSEFLSVNQASRAFFTPLGGGKWLADLPGLARQRLQAMGVDRIYGNDGSLKWCTVSNPLHFFSHRRDRITGRMAGCIWLD
jgi:YfiH family protein